MIKFNQNSTAKYKWVKTLVIACAVILAGIFLEVIGRLPQLTEKKAKLPSSKTSQTESKAVVNSTIILRDGEAIIKYSNGNQIVAKITPETEQCLIHSGGMNCLVSSYEKPSQRPIKQAAIVADPVSGASWEVEDEIGWIVPASIAGLFGGLLIKK